jgi:hypothetical protein
MVSSIIEFSEEGSLKRKDDDRTPNSHYNLYAVARCGSYHAYIDLAKGSSRFCTTLQHLLLYSHAVGMKPMPSFGQASRLNVSTSSTSTEHPKSRAERALHSAEARSAGSGGLSHTPIRRRSLHARNAS